MGNWVEDPRTNASAARWWAVSIQKISRALFRWKSWLEQNPDLKINKKTELTANEEDESFDFEGRRK